MINSLANSAEVIVLDIRRKIVCLESQLTITKIMSKTKEERSFLIKFIDIKFHNNSGMGSCLRNL